MKLGFGLGIFNKRNISRGSSGGGDGTIYGAMLTWAVNDVSVTQLDETNNLLSESLTVDASLTYTVTAA